MRSTKKNLFGKVESVVLVSLYIGQELGLSHLRRNWWQRGTDRPGKGLPVPSVGAGAIKTARQTY